MSAHQSLIRKHCLTIMAKHSAVYTWCCSFFKWSVILKLQFHPFDFTKTQNRLFDLLSVSKTSSSGHNESQTLLYRSLSCCTVYEWLRVVRRVSWSHLLTFAALKCLFITELLLLSRLYEIATTEWVDGCSWQWWSNSSCSHIHVVLATYTLM